MVDAEMARLTSASKDDKQMAEAAKAAAAAHRRYLDARTRSDEAWRLTHELDLDRGSQGRGPRALAGPRRRHRARRLKLRRCRSGESHRYLGIDQRVDPHRPSLVCCRHLNDIDEITTPPPHPIARKVLLGVGGGRELREQPVPYEWGRFGRVVHPVGMELDAVELGLVEAARTHEPGEVEQGHVGTGQGPRRQRGVHSRVAFGGVGSRLPVNTLR